MSENFVKKKVNKLDGKSEIELYATCTFCVPPIQYGITIVVSVSTPTLNELTIAMQMKNVSNLLNYYKLFDL